MNLINLRVILFLISFSLILTSCTKIGVDNSATPIVEENITQVSLPAKIYPVFNNDDEGNSSGVQIIPTPSSGTSVYSGYLYSVGEDLPARLVKIYFATKTLLTPGPEFMLSYQEKSSPQIQTDENGYFVISDIMPGEYYLVMVTPVNSFSVLDDNGNQVVVVAEGGKVFDLGKVFVNWP